MSIINDLSFKLIDFYFRTESSKYRDLLEVKPGAHICLNPKGILKVLKVYDRVFHYRIIQCEYNKGRLFEFEDRLSELYILLKMSEKYKDAYNIIEKRILNCKRNINKYKNRS